MKLNIRLTFNAFWLAAAMLISLGGYGQSMDEGNTLFKNYCASCHAKNMVADATGPALAGVAGNWESEEDLYAWIRNSQAMINAGHPRAVELWNQWKPVVMTSFESLTDQEIASILMYIDGVEQGIYPPKPAGGDVAATGAGVDDNSLLGKNWVYYGLLTLLVLLALFLANIINSLRNVEAEREGRTEDIKTFWQVLTSKSVISILLFGLVVFAGYTTVNRATELGRQQGYAPDQPIKFSHETHAGLHEIDCQYCHDGARRSKHSVIPATNTCMNCHEAIKVGSQYGTAEITKIFASAGFDPNTGQYIEDIESKSIGDLEKIYKQWFKAQYIADNDLTDIDYSGEIVVSEQWENLVSSLTNEQKETVYGPIEWTRIHNLPDHVYFNHAQHVTVGKVECQDCHGTVEEMEVVQQHAPLSMGWCINCHRQTNVEFSGNEYYESYAKMHEEMANGTRSEVKVAEIGGLECQKCHY